ncbi:MAG TPA: IPT/TIG domain-containing protein [Mycobacterium sp.]|nr:IPT/TIG domain-containing protein [Mycobacterium sp.]
MSHSKRGFVVASAAAILVVASLTTAPDAIGASAPTVTKVSPTSGTTAGGTRVTAYGKNFSHVNAVNFGTSKGTSLRVLSSTKLAITSPAHAAGVVNVRVTTSAGTSALVSADHFTYVAPPTVSAITPKIGPVAGGTSVAITGTNFVHVSAVKFGSTTGTGLVVHSSTSLTVLAPAAAAGTVNVRVTTSYGTSAAVSVDKYTYESMPTAGSYSGVEAEPAFNQTLTFYVSSDSSHIQDVTVYNRLWCVPNSKTVDNYFTLSSAAINTAGSFTASESHNGVVTIGGISYPASYAYAFTGNFHALNNTGVERAAGTWQETVTYNDGTAQSCTTNPLPWSVNHS